MKNKILLIVFALLSIPNVANAGLKAVSTNMSGGSGGGPQISLGTSVATANPSISGDLTTGFYTSGAAKVDVTISGVKIVEFGTTGESVSGNVAIGTTTATNSLTLATSNDFALYNTADQITNYERIRLFFAANVAKLITENSGTGVARNLVLGTPNKQFTIFDGASTAGFYGFAAGSSAANVYGSVFSGIWNSTSGINGIAVINPTISQTSTAGYSALLINPTESSTGSGVKNLIQAQTGSVDEFTVSDTGTGYFAGNVSIGTTSATNAITLPTNKDFAIYNTADQVTNYERLRVYWTGNTANILTDNGGTGTLRALTLGSGATMSILPSSSTGFIQFNLGTNVANGIGLMTNSAFGPSSGITDIVRLTPTFNATSTSGYNILHINPTETTTGSGAKRLISAQVGSVDKFFVDNAGAVSSAASFSLGTALLVSATAPTISSGFGSSPSITAGNAAAFTINVGTGASASSGVVGMPTASTAWNCYATDLSSVDTNNTIMSSHTSSSITLKNYARTTGLNTAWGSGDVIAVSCLAY